MSLFFTLKGQDSWSESCYMWGWEAMGMFCITGAGGLLITAYSFESVWFVFAAISLIIVSLFKRYKMDEKRAKLHYTGAGLCTLFATIGCYHLVDITIIYIFCVSVLFALFINTISFFIQKQETVFNDFCKKRLVILGENTLLYMLLFCVLI
jgi:hypothetical protein